MSKSSTVRKHALPSDPDLTKEAEKAEIVHRGTSGLPLATRSFGDPGRSISTLGTLQSPEATDFVIPEIVLHQGQISAKIYGPGNAGEWIDSMTLEKIDVERKTFVPLFAINTIQVWVNRQVRNVEQRFVGEFPTPASIPIAKMEDGSLEIRNHLQYFVIFEGDIMPRMLRFKSPDRRFKGGAYRVGAQIHTLETARRMRGLPLGAYRLSTRDITNDKGQWKGKVVTPAGDAKPEIAQLAEDFAVAFSAGRVTVYDREREHDTPVDSQDHIE